jgi:uncharacterized protein YegP (UPF0339 family)
VPRKAERLFGLFLDVVIARLYVHESAPSPGADTRGTAMRVLIVSVLFAGLGLAVSAQEPKTGPKIETQPELKPPQGWKEHKGGFKNEAYTVWLPPGGELDDKMSSIVTKKGQIRIYRTVTVTKDKAVYGAGQIQLPPDLTKATLKDRQDFFRDLFLDEVDGKLVEEKTIKVGIMVGKDYLIETPKGLARMQLIGPGVQVYRVIAIGTKEQIKSKETEAFFGSFVCRENRDPKKDDKVTGSIEMYKDESGKFRFRVKDADGKVIAVPAKGYDTEDECQKVIDALKATINSAKVTKAKDDK